VKVLAIPPVAGLDDGRFQLIAHVVAGHAFGLCAVNRRNGPRGLGGDREPVLRAGVRIQTERGHRVVDTGPYAIVCYPGYVAASFMFAGFALSLGSRWALIPAGFGSLVLVLRTIWEDRTLHAELPEYAAYARRVQFRLIPGVW
jgi:hypothetical protein